MSLARALLALPDEIEVTPWYDIRSEKKKVGAPRPKKEARTKPRKQRPRNLPDSIILECAQLAIIQCAYGGRTPWVRVVEWVWNEYGIIVTNHSVACTTREWMGAYRGQR